MPTHNHISTEKSKIKVKTKTLDKLCEQFAINKWALLKIDVDGEEVNILNSGLNSLDRFCFVVIECVIQRFTSINEILTNNDFTLFHINDICYIENMMSQFDAVYVNNKVKCSTKELNPSFNKKTWHRHTP